MICGAGSVVKDILAKTIAKGNNINGDTILWDKPSNIIQRQYTKTPKSKAQYLTAVTLVGKQGSVVKDLVPRIVCGAPPGNQSWEKAFQALEESAGAST